MWYSSAALFPNDHISTNYTVGNQGRPLLFPFQVLLAMQLIETNSKKKDK